MVLLDQFAVRWRRPGHCILFLHQPTKKTPFNDCDGEVGADRSSRCILLDLRHCVLAAGVAVGRDSPSMVRQLRMGMLTWIRTVRSGLHRYSVLAWRSCHYAAANHLKAADSRRLRVVFSSAGHGSILVSLSDPGSD